MKICLFAYGVIEQGGGLENYYIDIANYISTKTRYDLTIVTLDDQHTEKLTKLLSIFYHRKIDINKIKKIPSSELNIKLKGIKYIKSKSFKHLRLTLGTYDVIYAKNEILEAFTLKYLVGYNGLPPIIFGCHTPIYYPKADSIQARLHNILYSGVAYRSLAKRVSAFHVLNSSDEAKVKKLFPIAKIFKIVNPFSLDNFYLKSRQHVYPMDNDKDRLNIIWVGRLVLQKGIDDLCKIIEHINASIENSRFTWTIVGSGAEESYLKSKLSKYHNVKLLGQVDNNFLPSMYLQSDLYISTSHWEGYPYSILEAQAANLPVFSYDIPGCNDLVKNNVNGFLIKDIGGYISSLNNYIIHNNEYSFSLEASHDNENIYKNLIKMFEIISK